MKKSDLQVIQEAFDGGLNSAKFDMLQSRLRREPELAALYREYALLHHGLCGEFAHQQAGVAPHVAAPRVKPVRKRKPVAGKIFVALLALGAVAAGLWFLSRPVPVPEAPPSVSGARVYFSADAIWKTVGAGEDVHVSLPGGGMLELSHGSVRVDLANRISAVIEAPARLTYEHDQLLHLGEGRARIRQANPEAAFTVTTDSFSVVPAGGEFAVWARPNLPDELHVLEGMALLLPTGASEGAEIEAGNGGRVLGARHIEKFPARPETFAAALPEFRKHIDDDFLPGKWRVESGSPGFSAGGIQGAAFSAYRTLDGAYPNAAEPVVLATLAAGDAGDGAFHTTGRAGMGFMRGGEEVLFFGDGQGGDGTWSIDLGQGRPLVLPDPPVAGNATITLRYDQRSGLVTLHRGGLPLGPEICRADAGTEISFDEIRIGASERAGIHVRSIQLLSGGTPPGD